MMTESPPSDRHHDLRLAGGGVERPLVQRVDHVRADEGIDPAQHAAEDHHLGVEDVHQAAEAQAEVAPEGAQLRRRRGTRAGGTPAAGASRSSGTRPPRPPRASRSRSPSSPTLPHRQIWPCGLNGLVADLAGVPAGAHHRRSPDDDAATDADVAGEVDQVVHRPDPTPRVCSASAPSSASLPMCTETRAPIRLCSSEVSGDVAPAQVGGEAHQPGAVGDHARDGQPDADQPGVVGGALEHQPHHVDEHVDQRRRDRGWPAWWSTSGPAAARPDPTRATSIVSTPSSAASTNTDSCGRLHVDAGPAGAHPLDRSRLRCRLGHRGEVLELAHQVGDRRAVQPHARGQPGAGDPARAVDVPEQRRQVVSADSLLVGAGAVPTPVGHGQVPVAERRRLEIASTEAASSRTLPVMM